MTLPNTVLSFLQLLGILYYNTLQFTVVQTKVYYSIYDQFTIVNTTELFSIH